MTLHEAVLQLQKIERSVAAQYRKEKAERGEIIDQKTALKKAQNMSIWKRCGYDRQYVEEAWLGGQMAKGHYWVILELLGPDSC